MHFLPTLERPHKLIPLVGRRDLTTVRLREGQVITVIPRGQRFGKKSGLVDVTARPAFKTPSKPAISIYPVPQAKSDLAAIRQPILGPLPKDCLPNEL